MKTIISYVVVLNVIINTIQNQIIENIHTSHAPSKTDVRVYVLIINLRRCLLELPLFVRV